MAISSLWADCVGRWKLDDASDLTSGGWIDSTSFGHHLTAVGSVTGGLDRTGVNTEAIEFFDVSTSQMLSIPMAVDTPNLHFTNGMTAACWFNVQSLTIADDIPLMEQWTGNNAWILWLNNQKLEFWYKNRLNSFISTVASPAIVVNTWYHIAATWDLDFGETRVYLNGKLANVPPTATHCMNTNVATFFSIGGTILGAFERMRGFIDDAALWKRGISSAEVQELYSLTANDFPSDTAGPPPFKSTVGMLSNFQLSKQNSFGTSTANFKTMKITGETITTAINLISKSTLQNRFAKDLFIQGMETVKGKINFEIDPLRLGDLLFGAVGIVSTTNNTSVSGFQDYTHTFSPYQSNWDGKTALPPYTILIDKASGQSFKYADSVMNDLTLSVKAGGIMKGTIGLISRVTSLTDDVDPSFNNTIPWTWDVASFTINDVAIEPKNLSLTINNKIEPIFLLDGSRTANKYMRTNLQDVRIKGSFIFKTNTEYLQFKEFTDTNMKLFLNTMVDSGPTLLIDVPKFTYTKYSNPIPGPRHITANFEAEAEFDTTSNYAIQYTLTNTVTGY